MSTYYCDLPVLAPKLELIGFVILLNLSTATSDAVQYMGLPAHGQGILAIYWEPPSLVISKALLKPPSIFSIFKTGDVRDPDKFVITSHNFSTLK